MTTSPTAEFLSNAVETSGPTQREIARKAGFEKPNIISMMKLGETKVPIERIPALVRACDVEASDFLRVALQEDHPEMCGVMSIVFDSKLTDREIGIRAAHGAGLRVLATPSIYTRDDDFTVSTWLCDTPEPRQLPAELFAVA